MAPPRGRGGGSSLRDEVNAGLDAANRAVNPGAPLAARVAEKGLTDGLPGGPVPKPEAAPKVVAPVREEPHDRTDVLARGFGPDRDKPIDLGDLPRDPPFVREAPKPSGSAADAPAPIPFHVDEPPKIAPTPAPKPVVVKPVKAPKVPKGPTEKDARKAVDKASAKIDAAAKLGKDLSDAAAKKGEANTAIAEKRYVDAIRLAGEVEGILQKAADIPHSKTLKTTLGLPGTQRRLFTGCYLEYTKSTSGQYDLVLHTPKGRENISLHAGEAVTREILTTYGKITLTARLHDGKQVEYLIKGPKPVVEKLAKTQGGVAETLTNLRIKPYVPEIVTTAICLAIDAALLFTPITAEASQLLGAAFNPIIMGLGAAQAAMVTWSQRTRNGNLDREAATLEVK
ncbi:Uncharacterised protein [Candidatus Bilamarchaeum dharawalense]|uniref:Uncharacterized protein n=1 Tax=Candidatus Bilamarchaeum dharawalense TaxID=2885759 RepID=A0A5E4LTB0_9ARCH|nr:Uncharacterised protein [Candidatus Bilamarchaeum dharawalense]